MYRLNELYMNLFTRIEPLLFLLIIALDLCAQETTDTTTIKLKIYPQTKLINRNWELNFPTLKQVELPKPNFDKYLFEGNWQLKTEPFAKTLYSPGRESLHTYSSKALNTYVLSKPMMLGFDFHLKPLMGWDKLDAYLHGNGSLLNQDWFSEYEPGQAPPDRRTLFWEAGAGIEYELTERWSAFYQYSTGFANKTLLGSRHKAGVKYRF